MEREENLDRRLVAELFWCTSDGRRLRLAGRGPLREMVETEYEGQLDDDAPGWTMLGASCAGVLGRRTRLSAR